MPIDFQAVNAMRHFKCSILDSKKLIQNSSNSKFNDFAVNGVIHSFIHSLRQKISFSILIFDLMPVRVCVCAVGKCSPFHRQKPFSIETDCVKANRFIN